MHRAIVVLVSVIGGTAVLPVSAQSAAGDPTMRILDVPADAARVAAELDARRGESVGADGAASGRRARRRAAAEAQAPTAEATGRPDRSSERRRRKLDEHDDERSESALDDDDVTRVPSAVP